MNKPKKRSANKTRASNRTKKSAPITPEIVGLEIVGKTKAWQAWQKRLGKKAPLWAEAALHHAKFPQENTFLTLHLIGDRRMRTLNARFRRQDKPTNVLSFPLLKDPLRKERPKANQSKDQTIGQTIEKPPLWLGDVLLAAPYCLKEAKKINKITEAHLAHLTIHGILHLIGYDHDTDENARTMERIEKKALASLKATREKLARKPQRHTHKRRASV